MTDDPTRTNRYDTPRLATDPYGADRYGADPYDAEGMFLQRMRQRRATASRSSGSGALMGVGAALVGLGAFMVMQGMRQGDGDRSQASRHAQRDVHVQERITVMKPAGELFRFWRDLENLPRVMRHLASVERDPNTGVTHWVAEAPLGAHVSWDAEITNEVPDQMIAWRSLPGSQVATEGLVRFVRVGDFRTDLIVSMAYRPPGGHIGDAIAQWFGRDGQQEIQEDLQRFKEEVESGRLALA